MRELNFRAWDKDKKKYIDPFLIDLFGNTYEVSAEESEAKGCCVIIGSPNLVIEQYTGLKDKNGKEIYEGDILQDESNDAAVVIWREHQAEWGIKWIHMGIEDSLSHRMEWGHLNEIIGNIHKNTELLEHKG